MREKNLEHMKTLMTVLGCPELPSKHVNTLVALRASWVGKGFLNGRELRMIDEISAQYKTIDCLLEAKKEKEVAISSLGELHKAMEELNEKGLVVTKRKPARSMKKS